MSRTGGTHHSCYSGRRVCVCVYVKTRCFLTQETGGQRTLLWMKLQQHLPTEVYEPAWSRTGWRRTARAGGYSPSQHRRFSVYLSLKKKLWGRKKINLFFSPPCRPVSHHHPHISGDRRLKRQRSQLTGSHRVGPSHGLDLHLATRVGVAGGGAGAAAAALLTLPQLPSAPERPDVSTGSGSGGDTRPPGSPLPNPVPD